MELSEQIPATRAEHDPAVHPPLTLGGSLCARRAEFEALGYATSCRPGLTPDSPLGSSTIFLAPADWTSARWHAPGARLVVVGGAKSDDPHLVVLEQDPDREAIEAALARASVARPSSRDWRSWARIHSRHQQRPLARPGPGRGPSDRRPARWGPGPPHPGADPGRPRPPATLVEDLGGAPGELRSAGLGGDLARGGGRVLAFEPAPACPGRRRTSRPAQGQRP